MNPKYQNQALCLETPSLALIKLRNQISKENIHNQNIIVGSSGISTSVGRWVSDSSAEVEATEEVVLKNTSSVVEAS